MVVRQEMQGLRPRWREWEHWRSDARRCSMGSFNTGNPPSDIQLMLSDVDEPSPRDHELDEFKSIYHDRIFLTGHWNLRYESKAWSDGYGLLSSSHWWLEKSSVYEQATVTVTTRYSMSWIPSSSIERWTLNKLVMTDSGIILSKSWSYYAQLKGRYEPTLLRSDHILLDKAVTQLVEGNSFIYR